jgi:hypothetical protein
VDHSCVNLLIAFLNIGENPACRKRTPVLGGPIENFRKHREATSLERTWWCGQDIYWTTPPRLREVGGFATFLDRAAFPPQAEEGSSLT